MCLVQGWLQLRLSARPAADDLHVSAPLAVILRLCLPSGCLPVPQVLEVVMLSLCHCLPVSSHCLADHLLPHLFCCPAVAVLRLLPSFLSHAKTSTSPSFSVTLPIVSRPPVESGYLGAYRIKSCSASLYYLIVLIWHGSPSDASVCCLAFISHDCLTVWLAATFSSVIAPLFPTSGLSLRQSPPLFVFLKKSR